MDKISQDLLYVIQLSDIHLVYKDKTIPAVKSNPVLSRVKEFSDAFQSFQWQGQTKVVLLISGDVAYSGQIEEYLIAEEFINEIKNVITRRVAKNNIYIYTIPGNHDLYLPKVEKIRNDTIENIIKGVEIDESYVELCSLPQRNYFDFYERLSGNKFEGYDKLYNSQILYVGNKIVKFHLFNSSWLSKRREDGGMLLVPFDKIGFDDRKADYVITVFHHPYNWLNVYNSKEFKRKIEQVSDLVLTGHEHTLDIQTISKPTGEKARYVEGGVTQDNYAPENSSFNIFIFDLKKRKQQHFQFNWNNKYYAKQEVVYEDDSLLVNPFRIDKTIELNEKFVAYIQDPGAQIINYAVGKVKLDDIFINPDITFYKDESEKNSNDSIRAVRKKIKSDDSIDEVLKHNNIVLYGSDKAGKTSLAKRLFEILYFDGSFPLLMNGSDISSFVWDSIETDIEKLYNKIYLNLTYNEFKALDRERKTIIIDDFYKTKLSPKRQQEFLDAISMEYGRIIIFTSESIFAENILNLSPGVKRFDGFTKASIQDFGLYLQSQIIEKWYDLDEELDEESKENKAKLAFQKVDSILKTKIVPKHPLFILTTLQQIDSPMDVGQSNNYGSHAHFYEILIKLNLARDVNKDIDYNTKLLFLSHIAMDMLKRNCTYSESVDINETHRSFCDIYDRDLSKSDLMDDLIEIGFLIKDGADYKFAYHYMMPYFAATYISNNITESDSMDAVKNLCDNLHVQINGNIMLFLSHLSKHPFIIETLLEKAKRQFSDFKETDLGTGIAFLNRMKTKIPEYVHMYVDPKVARKNLLNEKDQEREYIEQEEKMLDIEYKEKEAYKDESASKVVISSKTMDIMGQILKSFANTLKADQKEELVVEIFKLSMRLLAFKFSVMENFIKLIVFNNLDVPDDMKAKSASEEKKAVDSIGYLLYLITEAITYSSIIETSDNLVGQNLEKTYQKFIENNHSSNAAKLVRLSISLELSGRQPPTNEIVKLYREIKDTLLVEEVLRDIVARYMDVNYIAKDKIRSIYSQIGMKLEDVQYIKKVDRRLKR